MDIICARCGKHFSSVESARDHRGKCKETSSGESIRWIPAKESKLTPEEWKQILELVNSPRDSTVNNTTHESTGITELSTTIFICPNCSNNLYHDYELQLLKCKKCKRVYTYDDLRIEQELNPEGVSEQEEVRVSGITPEKREPPQSNAKEKAFHLLQLRIMTRDLLLTLLLIFSLSVLGIGISIFTDIYIPLYMLIGFALIYPIEKWFYYLTNKHKNIARLYRLFINLSILSLLYLMVWSGIKLFSQKPVTSPLVDSLIFFAEFIFFIWMWRVISRNSKRWPSMKLTVFSLLCIFVVFAFAGVNPLSDYKDKILDGISSIFSTITNNSSENSLPGNNNTSAEYEAENITSSDDDPNEIATAVVAGINSATGEYRNYYLGLVETPDGVQRGEGCYGRFIVLINNGEANNPTYSELLDFLRSDSTDEFPYQYVPSGIGYFYGAPEDQIDLEVI